MWAHPIGGGNIVTRDVVKLEEQGWRALSSSPGEAVAFYDDVLDERVVMVLPGGTILDDRAAILDSMSGSPWASYEIEGLLLVQPTDDVVAVVYAVTARRAGDPEYSAHVASTYVRRDEGWKLTLHQQTPR